MQASTFICAAALVLCASAGAAERLTVTVTHDLDAARPSETIVIPWKDVNAALPGALIQHLVVKDATGHALPYQVTNVAPQAKDPQGVGVAYGELLFQHDFAPGEKAATFVVEKSDALTPPFAAKAFARYVPERLDDFAWENDVIGHRTYGPALAAPAPPGSGKEVLETSGLDIWFKRVDYPIVDRWYNKGHDHYHKDEGEGMDMYNVGTTPGAGGTGIWAGGKLWSGINFTRWKVLANVPVRAIFELAYDGWDAAGTQVSEVKRFTVDAGHYFDRIDSTFRFAGGQPLQAAAGLNKAPADKGEDGKSTITEDAAHKALVQWVAQKKSGDFGVAVILPSAKVRRRVDARRRDHVRTAVEALRRRQGGPRRGPGARQPLGPLTTDRGTPGFTRRGFFRGAAVRRRRPSATASRKAVRTG
jgi:hypothetical protein